MQHRKENSLFWASEGCTVRWRSPGMQLRVSSSLLVLVFWGFWSVWQKQQGRSSGSTAVRWNKKVMRRLEKCLFWACICLVGPITEHKPLSAAWWWQSVVYRPNGADLSLEQGGVTLLKSANCPPVSADCWFFFPFPPFPAPSITIPCSPQWFPQSHLSPGCAINAQASAWWLCLFLENYKYCWSNGLEDEAGPFWGVWVPEGWNVF